MSKYKIDIVISLSQSQSQNKLDNSINNDIIEMDSFKTILARMNRNPKDSRFKDVCKVCDHYFGLPRQKGSSHRIYRTPWPGDPRINIQSHKGKAKACQASQVLAAIGNMESEDAKK